MDCIKVHLHRPRRIILEDIGQEWIPVVRDYRLNERHYGALQVVMVQLLYWSNNYRALVVVDIPRRQVLRDSFVRVPTFGRGSRPSDDRDVIR